MITVITNRKHIAYTDLVTHLKKCVHSNVDRIILREKDLGLEEITKKIERIKKEQSLKDIPLLLNGPYPVDKCYGADGRHFTMEQYKEYLSVEKKPSMIVGVSVHSLEEIIWLKGKKPDYALYGHIFPTACKAGLQQRGLDNLKVILDQATFPVAALGGIGLDNYEQLYAKGARSFAMMSSVMAHEDPMTYLGTFKNHL